jgi:hypothetical protein
MERNDMTTNQTLFDTVVRHLWAQGKRVHLNGNCKYRAPGGLKCAVGCLIPDDKYTADMDNPTDNGLETVMPKAGISMRHEFLLAELQIAHDVADHWNSSNTAPLSSLAVRLARIANEFNLRTNVLQEVSA